MCHYPMIIAPVKKTDECSIPQETCYIVVVLLNVMCFIESHVKGPLGLGKHTLID